MKLSDDQLKALIKEQMNKLGIFDQVDDIARQHLTSIRETEMKKLRNEETYEEVYFRMDRLKKCTLLDAPSTILANEIRMLLEAYVKVHPEITFEIDYTYSQEEV